MDHYYGRLMMVDVTRDDLVHAELRIEVDGQQVRWSFCSEDDPVADPVLALQMMRDRLDARRRNQRHEAA